jgi:hypothetical protein
MNWIGQVANVSASPYNHNQLILCFNRVKLLVKSLTYLSPLQREGNEDVRCRTFNHDHHSARVYCGTTYH